MEKWFTNVKQKLAQHLMTDSHNKAVSQEMKDAAETLKVKDQIFQSMRQLAYFGIKSNLPLDQFSSLLATVNTCGLDLGDINHSRTFITKFLELINIELVKKTVQWFHDQSEITLTLDIGTVYGITLLAVLFISDGKVKLANILPIVSKKGKDVAEASFEACKLYGKIDAEENKRKVVGITGDGAFAKGRGI